MSTVKAYEEVIDFIAAGTSPNSVIHFHPVDVEFDLRKNRNWVELDGEIAKYLRELAKEQHVSTRTLANEFLREKIESLR